jgi:hypothetical protein
MKRFLMLCFLLQAVFLQAQKNHLSDGDSVNERTRASLTLRNLRNGSVVVRLKTSQKSIEAYRKAGKNEIADRIEDDRKKQNLKIYDAFAHNFDFCKIYFIYATETQAFLKGQKGLLLNRNLEHDPSIIFTDSNFIFCEYGSANPFSEFNDETGLTPPTEVRTHDKLPADSGKTSTSPVYGFFFSDKNLKQFQRPFPYVEDAYFGSYDKAVRNINRELHQAYGRLVVNQDFRDRRKQDRKKSREMLQRQP